MQCGSREVEFWGCLHLVGEVPFLVPVGEFGAAVHPPGVLGFFAEGPENRADAANCRL